MQSVRASFCASNWTRRALMSAARRFSNHHHMTRQSEFRNSLSATFIAGTFHFPRHSLAHCVASCRDGCSLVRAVVGRVALKVEWRAENKGRFDLPIDDRDEQIPLPD
ncbi:hypothetical protein MES4922_290102 [Mesorhizobium ventifaucium]|uniref:Uncharacterized protein n=1 Tax=Mesorhizobium ventifaucium TaxID=666020 RepID=A0ABN8JUQ7_9HYPH|nr:hypothetical protein MES4922_290102 [Mesorhizobium ventifaucium]